MLHDCSVERLEVNGTAPDGPMVITCAIVVVEMNVEEPGTHPSHPFQRIQFGKHVLVPDVHTKTQKGVVDFVYKLDHQIRQPVCVVLKYDDYAGIGPTLDFPLPELNILFEPMLLEFEEIIFWCVAAMQDQPTGLELHSNVKRHIESVRNSISDQVIDVGIFHPNERTMYGNGALELVADGHVQHEPMFPVPFRLNTKRAVASEFYSNTKPGNLRQEEELFRFSTHTEHQVHLDVLMFVF
jgi:hypothetical protein